MERNEIEYDPETNLPKLREGLFWKFSDSESGYVNISIVEEETYQKHQFLCWKWGWVTKYPTYEGLYGYLREGDLSDDEIKDTAEHLYKKLVGLDSRKERVASLVGVYPPKKL